MANNTISVNVTPATVVENNVNVVVENKEETTMTTTTNGYMGTVIGMAVEDLNKLSLKDLKASAQVIDLKGRSKMNKAELIEALTPYCDPTKKVEIIEKTEAEVIMDAMASAPVEATVVKEEKEETEMNKELTPVTVDTVNALAVLAKSYDPFTAYIDNGRQKDSADRANAKIRASWDAICESCGINLWIGNEDWSNASLENAEKAIASWLGIELPKANVVVETKVVEKKEETNMVKTTTNVTLTEEQKRANGDKLVYQLCIAWIMQTKYDFMGDGKKLFYIPTVRTDLNKKQVLICKRERIKAITGSLIAKMFGEKYNTDAVIMKAYRKMEEKGFCHVVPTPKKDKDGNVVEYFDIHMTAEEFNKAVTVYSLPALAQARKDYVDFVKKTVRSSRKQYAKTATTATVVNK